MRASGNFRVQSCGGGACPSGRLRLSRHLRVLVFHALSVRHGRGLPRGKPRGELTSSRSMSRSATSPWSWSSLPPIFQAALSLCGTHKAQEISRLVRRGWARERGVDQRCSRCCQLEPHLRCLHDAVEDNHSACHLRLRRFTLAFRRCTCLGLNFLSAWCRARAHSRNQQSHWRYGLMGDRGGRLQRRQQSPERRSSSVR